MKKILLFCLFCGALLPSCRSNGGVEYAEEIIDDAESPLEHEADEINFGPSPGD